MLLFAIYKNPLKCFRNPTSFFIANLGIADLLNSLINLEELFVSQTVYKTTFCFPDVWGMILPGIVGFIFLSTFPSVTVLALERYISIAHPLWHQVKAGWQEMARKMLELRLRNQNRFLSTLLIINIVLTFGLIPTIISLYLQYRQYGSKTEGTMDVWLPVTNILLFLNTAANPFLYIWRLPKYRKTFSVMYCCKNK